MRQWQAGDLVRRASGEWHFIEWIDNGEPISASDGCTCLGATLLAAADADLWEALRGLPGADVIGEREVEIYLGGDLEACIVDRGDGPQCWLRTYDNLHSGTAPLEQAIQRWKALKQYVEVRNGK